MASAARNDGNDNDEMFDSSKADSHGANSAVSGSGTNAGGFLARRGLTDAPRLVYAVAIILLLAGAVISPIVTFRTQRDAEMREFERVFGHLSSAALDQFGRKVASTLSTSEGLSLEITTYAMDSGSTWPFITLPFFDYLSLNTISLSQILSITFAPIVTMEDRPQWEEYVANNTWWVYQAIERHAPKEGTLERRLVGVESMFAGDVRSLQGSTDPSQPKDQLVIPDVKDGVITNIYTIDPATGTRHVDPTPGPYVPAWQFVPLSPVGINWNYRTPPFFDTPDAAIATGRTTISTPFWFVGEALARQAAFYTFALRQKTGNPNITYEGEATSTYYYPVFDGVEADRKVAGVLVVTLFWPFVFADALPPSTEPIHVVIRNACGGSFTMSIEGDKAVHNRGEEIHDPSYEDHAVHRSLTDIVSESGFDFDAEYAEINPDFCPYTFHVYPSEELHNKYVTSGPIISAIIASAAFLFAMFILVSYDFVVKWRLSRIARIARDHGERVYALYPNGVRERVMERLRESSSPYPKEQKARATATVPIPEESKVPLIADSFPECTVMFSYFDGFEEWSSGREANDIFILLEKAFSCIDDIGRKHKIFKVNTVFDSYFAVTGLPRSQPDHAVRMSRFVLEAMKALQGLFSVELSEMFGSDTVNIRWKVGLHSGRVNAGLHAGDNVRFDVLGDTVKIAQALASNSAPGRIHVSLATAEWLTNAGLSQSLTERDDPVVLRETTTTTTYWLGDLSPGDGGSDDSLGSSVRSLSAESKVPARENSNVMEFLGANHHLANRLSEESTPMSYTLFGNMGQMSKEMSDDIMLEKDSDDDSPAPYRPSDTREIDFDTTTEDHVTSFEDNFVIT